MASVIVSSGQSVSNLSFTGGDDLTVSAGGVSRDDFVGVPGVETVYGSSFGDTVSGRQQTGTSASIAVFVAGSGAVVSNVTVLNGAFLAVSAGANVYGAVFSNASGGGSGALTNVSVGGGSVVTAAAVVGGTVGSGGMLSLNALNVPGTPTTTGVTVYSGGTFDIAFAVASGTVLSGGTAFTSARVPFAGYDGEALGTRILAGGVLSVQNFTAVSGTVIGSGGLERLGVSARAYGDVISGGTLELEYGNDGYHTYGVYTAQEYGPILFAGGRGTLLDDGTGQYNTSTPPGALASVISGFNSTDRIILAGVAADPNATLTVSGDTATVSAGGSSYTLDIAGASTLGLTLGIGTGAGNIDIGSGIACYCAGTAITTPDGERPVETLAPGDLVTTADGRAEPVVWVGQRSYAGRFLRRQPHLLPIRIRAGALGPRLPRRDLLVSPNHALLLDGALVPAEALVGAPGITVECGCERVEYHHIELARHDVILAEGAAAETFVDDDSRALFHASEGTPGSATTYCAPRLADGYQIDTIRRSLAA